MDGGAGAIEVAEGGGGGGGERLLEGLEEGEDVVEGVEADVEALGGAAGRVAVGVARGVRRAGDGEAAGVDGNDAGVARNGRLLPELGDSRILVAPCQWRMREYVALLRALEFDMLTYGKHFDNHNSGIIYQ